MTAASGPRRLALEVRFEAEPIQGRLYDQEDDRVDRPFRGWLGLISALEAARRTGPVPQVEPKGEDP